MELPLSTMELPFSTLDLPLSSINLVVFIVNLVVFVINLVGKWGMKGYHFRFGGLAPAGRRGSGR
jgi:Zn-dependent protease